jgi:ribose 5-phosphate isomerase A
MAQQKNVRANGQDQIKQKVGQKAAEFVQNGMLIGIGTGTTAHYFIESLIGRCQEGLKITAVSTSEKSTSQARSGGIHVLEMDAFTNIDLTIDGADEIDPSKRLIKGGGGALLREKIIASSSNEMIVIADESKLVKHLGSFGLPVEIIPFGYRATLSKLYHLGYLGEIRKNKDGSLYVTDNGNYIFDVHFQPVCSKPEEDQAIISRIPGVVETGLFIDIAGRIIIGFKDGRVEVFNNLPQSLPFI